MKNTLKEKIFSKIEKEKIQPIPESYFVKKQKLLWWSIIIFLIFATIFVGFLSDDTMEFFSLWWHMWGNWHVLFFPNIFWIALILFLLFMAFRKLRDTAVGYRNSYAKDILIGIIVILFWSLIFRWIGLWPMIHSFVATNIPVVSNFLYNESSWNDPENGKLAGIIIGVEKWGIRLQSTDGGIWNIDMRNAVISPMVVGKVNEKIRIIWKKTSDSDFVAERMIPWFGKWMGNGWWRR